MKVRIFLFSIFILLSAYDINALEKIIFKIKDNNYTTIDLKNRQNYLITINSQMIEKKEIYNDFVTVLLFNEYADKINLKIEEQTLNEYYQRIKKNIENEENIKKNLLYDLQRKFIIEKFLEKEEETFLIKNTNKINIYNYLIKYLIIYDQNKSFINELENNIDLKKFNKIENYLKKNNITYKYLNKEEFRFENLDNKFKNIISNYKKNFKIINNDYIIIGEIDWIIKNNIEAKLNFYQINHNDKIMLSEVKCENINNLYKDKNLKIKFFEKIDLQKINETIKKNLIKKNDLFIVNDKTIIILCDINYNKNLLDDYIISNLIKNKVTEIELKFINDKSIEYKYMSYE